VPFDRHWVATVANCANGTIDRHWHQWHYLAILIVKSPFSGANDDDPH
jgi:hypothetical protein